MKPLLSTDRGVIIHGEAIEFLQTLPDRSIDHAIMDPPYSPLVHNTQRRGCTGYVEPSRPGAKRAQTNRKRELGFDPLTPELRRVVCEELARILKRWALVFCEHEGTDAWKRDAEAAGLEYVRAMIWRKRGATPQFTGDRPGQGHEVIVTLHQKTAKGKNIKKRWNGGGKHGFYEHPIVLNRNGKTPRLHTAQKPLALMEQLVEDFTDPGDTIVDPFAGSGTTLEAAHKLGRNWIGVERDAKYAETIYTRMMSAMVANDNE